MSDDKQVGGTPETDAMQFLEGGLWQVLAPLTVPRWKLDSSPPNPSLRLCGNGRRRRKQSAILRGLCCHQSAQKYRSTLANELRPRPKRTGEYFRR